MARSIAVPTFKCLLPHLVDLTVRVSWQEVLRGGSLSRNYNQFPKQMHDAPSICKHFFLFRGCSSTFFHYLDHQLCRDRKPHCLSVQAANEASVFYCGSRWREKVFCYQFCCIASSHQSGTSSPHYKTLPFWPHFLVRPKATLPLTHHYTAHHLVL